MWNLLLGNNILWGKDLSLMWITVEKIRKTFHEKNFNLFSSSWHLEEKYTDNFGVALSHHHPRLSYFFWRIIRIIIIIIIITTPSISYPSEVAVQVDTVSDPGCPE